MRFFFIVLTLFLLNTCQTKVKDTESISTNKEDASSETTRYLQEDGFYTCYTLSDALKMPDKVKSIIDRTPLIEVDSIFSEIDKLIHLEYLEITNPLFQLSSLPAEIAKLQKLEVLIIEPNEGIRYLPEEFGQLNLKKLRIKLDSNLNEVPEILWQLNSLEELSIDSRINRLSKKIAQLSNLKSLIISNFDHRERANLVIGHPCFSVLDKESKEYHESNRRGELEDLPTEIRALNNLESLTITNNKLKSIPSSIDYLKKLKNLNLACNLIEAFPVSLSNLQNLNYLNLRGTYLKEEERTALRKMLPNTKISF